MEVSPLPQQIVVQGKGTVAGLAMSGCVSSNQISGFSMSEKEEDYAYLAREEEKGDWFCSAAVCVGVWLLCLFFECRPVNWVFVDVVVFASIVICVVIPVARMIRDWDKRYDFDLGEEAADEASGN